MLLQASSRDAHTCLTQFTLRQLLLPLNHPGGAVGYRVEHEGLSIAVISDHEHGDSAIDAAVRRFVEGADVMVYDATNTGQEYAERKGWGHSTGEEAIGLAADAGVRIPVLFHHLPERDDAALDAIVEAARRSCPAALAAREGTTIKVERRLVEAEPLP